MENNKVIVEFYWDLGRMGEVSSTFVCDKSQLGDLYGREVYFGEILGKHSEVYGTVEEGHLTIKSEDQEFIKKFQEIMGENWSTGHNPLYYLEE